MQEKYNLDDIYDKKLFRPFLENDFSEQDKKNFAVIEVKQNIASESRNIILLIAEKMELAKGQDRQGEVMRVLNLLRSKKYNIEQTFNVPADRIKEILNQVSGYGTGTVGAAGEVREEFDKMLSFCLDNNISDIHILSYQTGARVLVRQDGDLEVYGRFSYEMMRSMMSAVYSAEGKESEGTHFIVTESQQAVIRKQIDGINLQLRFQSTPIFPDGFKVIMRLLNLGRMEEGGDLQKYLQLSDLGYAPSHVDNIEMGTAKPVGATIIAGVTGSGKSTTLKHLLMSLNEQSDFKKSFYTLEDPPEYLIPGVAQIGVSRNKNAREEGVSSPYEKPLKVLMRADPDVIMLGEIRDNATAEGLVKAAESGHKVLSTTHASSALEIVKRLYNFNVSPNDMASPSTLSCLIYQKLLPTLCPHCKERLSDKLQEADVSERLLKLKNRLKDVADLDKDPIYIRRKGGCTQCSGRGIKGRSVCAETILPDLTLLTLFRDQKMIEAKEYWRSLSNQDPNSDDFTGKTVLEHAIWKMRKGTISPLDIETELGPINAAYKEFVEIQQREKNKRAKEIGQYLFGGNMNFALNKSEEDGFEL